MKILCVGQVEDRTNIDQQILKQTIQPDRTIFYVDENPAKGIDARRIRIAENHEKLREIVEAYKPDLVWQVEGDGVMPENTLERLLGHYIRNPDVACYSGVEVGRHGLYCLGAWHVAKDRKSYESVDYRLKGLQEVDAMGMYCFLMPANIWLATPCYWNGERWGPDVNFFLNIAKPKYVDMGLHIGHKTKTGTIEVSHISTCNAKFWEENGTWEYKQL